MHLDKTKLIDITLYLEHHELIIAGDVVVYAEKPGEGNMNYTLRVKTKEDKSLIIKQARSYVEKYPSIPAPEERILVESKFYDTIREDEFLKTHIPKILLTDKENHILVMEDLGVSTDYSSLYKKGNQLSVNEAKLCSLFISQLHNNFKKKEEDALMSNLNLKILNHEHIFVYPFLEENGFDLDSITPGLQSVAMKYKKDDNLKSIAKKLGKIYLANGNTLIHGDYYPGSWLNTQKGIMIIDPEFAFYGTPEFDLGVLYAHLSLSQQPDEVFQSISANYKKPKNFDDALLNAFTGIEMMRRIIGLAQLPLDLSLNEKEELLEKAYKLLN